MDVVIIDYGAGNIFSVEQVFKRLGVTVRLSSDPEEIKAASHVIFPGVGHAKSAMEQLKATGLDVLIPMLTQPVLGICLGMQLMCGYNEEGELEGLGIFDVEVRDLSQVISEFGNSEIREFGKSRITPEKNGFQVPHMGWNDVQFDNKTEAFYFVHSYAAGVCADTWGITSYPMDFSASLKKGNFWGVQFHPEKSGEAGERLLREFLEEQIDSQNDLRPDIAISGPSTENTDVKMMYNEQKKP